MAELDLETLLKRDPHEILTYVESSIAAQPHVSNVYTWEELAEKADSNARNHTSMEISLLWAKIAVVVYTYLYSSLDNTDDPHRVSLECYEMRLRKICIAKFGPQKNEALLDPEYIVEWFFSNTKLSLDEVKALLNRLSELSVEKILELRSIKERLRVIKELYDDHYISADAIPEIEKWLSIRTDLP